MFKYSHDNHIHSFTEPVTATLLAAYNLSNILTLFDLLPIQILSKFGRTKCKRFYCN